MNIPAFCISRPALTIVMSTIMTIVGIIGFMNLPVRWIPNVSPPVVFVSTTYPGANANVIEHDVTKVIEESLSGINGIETITSYSNQNESYINIEFKLGEDLDKAISEVRANVERTRSALPKEALNPLIMKADRNSMPILFISFADSNYSQRELSDYIVKYIAPSFETIDGVGSVPVYGKRNSIMRISLDPSRMAAAQITVDDVMNSLQNENASLPSGQIQGKDRYYSIITDTTLKNAQQFNDIVIREDDHKLIKLQDIGHASVEPEDNEAAFRVNGKAGIALGIIPQSNSNPLAVEQAVRTALKDIKRTLPLGMSVNIIWDQTEYIRSSIASVYESFFEAVIFVWLVILAFLCNMRATFIPIITIPVCMISTFAVLHFFHFSINTISLMALVLAIGLVVDDAIVMLENINRYLETGMNAFAAAIKGSGEIIFPIIAMTLTLAAVYAPIAFTSGLMGVLFKEFTVTLAAAVIISGIVALTLSPMMCAALLKSGSKENRYSIWLNHFLKRLQNTYQRWLTLFIKKRKWIMLGLLFVTIAGVFLYRTMPSELAPGEDMGEINAYISAPRGASFNYTNDYVKQLEAIYQNEPDIDYYLSQVGAYSSNHAWQMIKLKPKNQREMLVAELVEKLSGKLNKFPGVRANVYPPSPPLAEYVSGGNEGDNIGLVLMTTSDYPRLQEVTKDLMEQIQKIKGVTHVDNQLKWDSEQLKVSINRDKAADLGVAIPTITNTLSTMLAGRTIGKVDEADVIVKMNKDQLTNANVFADLYVKNKKGDIISLANLLTVVNASLPQMFVHYDRLRADTIYLTLDPSLKIDEAVTTLETLAKATLPEDMKFKFTGEAKSFLETKGKTMITFLLALLFIYLILVAQFESFIDPLIILLTVPFAIVGSLLTLRIFGGSLNIYSQIGLVTLVGLIAKHGILITDFANKLRATGKSIEQAVTEAAILRLRPILMTTAAMVLGALPLAIASGPGAESRQQIGLVIAGGMLIGTIFSLIVVPIVYTYLAPFSRSKRVRTS